jgi:hypothetical protein
MKPSKKKTKVNLKDYKQGENFNTTIPKKSKYFPDDMLFTMRNEADYMYSEAENKKRGI